MSKCFPTCSNFHFELSITDKIAKFANVTVFPPLTTPKRTKLNVDQVPTGRGHVLRGTIPGSGGGLLLLVLQIFLVLLVLNRLRAAVRVAVVVEEASEGELVEGVLGVARVQATGAVAVAVLAVVTAAPALFWLHRVEVGRVGGVGNSGHVGRRLLTWVAREVSATEKGVRLDLVGAVGAEAVLRSATQLHNQVRHLGAEPGLRRDSQRTPPVDHLQEREERTEKNSA